MKTAKSGLPDDIVDELEELSDEESSDEEITKPKKSKASKQNKKTDTEAVTSLAASKPEAEAEEPKKFDCREAADRTIFIGSLPYSVDRRDVGKLFKKFGKIEAVYKRSTLQKNEKLMKTMFKIDKKLRGTVQEAHFYVRFTNAESANEATSLNGTKFKKYFMRVTLSNRKTVQDPKNSVFVGNVPYTTSENALINFFDKSVGNVKSANIVRDKATGLAKGFSIVEFSDRPSAVKALELDGIEFQNRKLRIQRVPHKKKDVRALKKPTELTGEKKMKEDALKQKLSNYIVTKPTKSTPKKKGLTKKVRKEIRKRKEHLGKNLL